MQLSDCVRRLLTRQTAISVQAGRRESLFQSVWTKPDHGEIGSLAAGSETARSRLAP